MYKKSNSGFTLLEILVSLGVLVVGIVGILSLFPAGLRSSQKAAEETYAAFIADSVYASLRAAAEQMAPGDDLVFFHDGINVEDPSTLKNNPANNVYVLPDAGSSMGIPAIGDDPFVAQIATNDYFNNLKTGGNLKVDNFVSIGQSGPAANTPFNVNVLQKDENQSQGLGQYSFNVEIAYPPQGGQPQVNPKGLFDVTIRIARGGEILKRFHSKIFIPTNKNN